MSQLLYSVEEVFSNDGYLKEFEKATNLFPIEKIYPYSFIENAEQLNNMII